MSIARRFHRFHACSLIILLMIITSIFFMCIPLAAAKFLREKPRSSTATISSDQTGDEWPMYRGALNHTGMTTTIPMQDTNPLWIYTTRDYIYSTPSIVGGCLFVGCNNDKVYCLNATTGTSIWNFTTNGEVHSSVAIASGRVYVGSDDHYLYCIDFTSGGLLWKYKTKSQVDSSPAIAYGCVYVGCGDDKVYCLNATRGTSIWNYTTGNEIRSSPAIANGCVYVGSRDDKVYCLNTTSGASIWNYTTNDGVFSSPAIADGRVYVGSLDDSVYCLNGTTGALIWRYTTPASVGSSPAIAGGRVYVGSDDGKVYCLNALTGASIWNYTTNDADWSSPVVADGRVYVGTGNIYCLDATMGALVWSFTTHDLIFSTPAIAGGRVYMGSVNGKLYCMPMILISPAYVPSIIAMVILAGCAVTIGIAIIINKNQRPNKTIEFVEPISSEPAQKQTPFDKKMFLFVSLAALTSTYAFGGFVNYFKFTADGYDIAWFIQGITLIIISILFCVLFIFNDGKMRCDEPLKYAANHVNRKIMYIILLATYSVNIILFVLF